MVKSGKILIVDDNEDILFSLKLLLKQHIEKIETESDPEKLSKHLDNEDFDVILLDMNFTKDSSSGQEGFYYLEKILQKDPLSVVIFITAYGDVEKAVHAIKAGATDFVLKPWNNDKILATIHSAIKLSKSKKENFNLKNKNEELSRELDSSFKDFIGKSSAMQNVFELIEKVAKTDANILILGENGTGKELVARAIHRNSLRKKEVFLSVDLGTINENLFESELFGHIKGAFTDAKKDKVGRFELASGGTIFLDEIGNLSLPMQSKILTAIEKNEIIRVGDTKPKKLDVRLISATNMPLLKMISENDFRQDLFFRINTVEIKLPPLRERGEDILLIAEFFIKEFSKKYKKDITKLTTAAEKKLLSYSWPGNVRELKHTIERAIIMCDSNALDENDFMLSISENKNEMKINTFNLDEIEHQIIEKALAKYQGNVSQAAKELGLTRASLYRRLEKYGI